MLSFSFQTDTFIKKAQSKNIKSWFYLTIEYIDLQIISFLV